MSERTVFKYPLPLTSTPNEIIPLHLPAGAKILKAAEQGSDPLIGPRLFIWALVDPDEKLQETRYVVTCGTGHKMKSTTLSEHDWDYVDTLICLGGRLLVHVWITPAEGKDAYPDVTSSNG
jgi:hypothetical protein